MKRHVSIILTIFVLMVTGITLSYAAFPVSAPVSSAAPAPASAPTAPASMQDVTPATTVAKAVTTPAPAGNSGKSQIVALILCFFLGGLGIHRFYLGYTWQGVVQLLTGGGCGIWVLIDFIRIITGDLQPKNGRYSKEF
jgi:hypothetical protein